MGDGADPVAFAAQAQDAPEMSRERTLSGLYRLYWNEIVRYIQGLWGPGPPEPEDVAQAAFTQYAALKTPDTIENPRAFLYQCARNYVIDQRRKEIVRSKYRLTVAGEDSSDEINAERVLEAKQHVEILNRVLAKMDPRQREVLLMLKIEGLTFAEIAKRLGCSQTWTKKLAGLALAECARAIRKADGE